MKIALIQGHPDPHGGHFGHVLAHTYAQAARAAGHDVRAIEVAQLEFPLLRSAAEWREGTACEPIRAAQQTLAWAEHVVIVFPLWLGDVPALLKGFFEQALRPGFAIDEGGRLWRRLLKGRSARIVATMGMPAFFYRLYYRSHSVKSLKRNILEFCGIKPVRTTLIGTVDSGRARQRALARLQSLGRTGS